jgi:phage-related protein
VQKLHILTGTNEYLDSVPEEQSAKILADLEFLRMNQTEGLTIKPLDGKIRELVVKQHRIVFFEYKGVVYVVDAFKKQSKKTPKRVIERAKGIHRYVVSK